jgi:hypothetical protein
MDAGVGSKEKRCLSASVSSDNDWFHNKFAISPVVEIVDFFAVTRGTDISAKSSQSQIDPARPLRAAMRHGRQADCRSLAPRLGRCDGLGGPGAASHVRQALSRGGLAHLPYR